MGIVVNDNILSDLRYWGQRSLVSAAKTWSQIKVLVSQHVDNEALELRVAHQQYHTYRSLIVYSQTREERGTGV